ncbi:hypothetical protein [Enterococcus nangangensis]|uniref:hypothetical protein n=1 Tax=Enterococcus nangangensis TaxID=2559926 RepID=UPI001484D960|nr:hypothetical protein [Enterococcus nangangensis]
MGFWVMVLSFVAGIFLIVKSITLRRKIIGNLFLNKIALFGIGCLGVVFAIYLGWPK